MPTSHKRKIISAIFALICLSAFSQKIAVLSDIHVSPGDVCDSVLRIAVDEINSASYDLVVVDGDLSYEGSAYELENVKGILDKVRHRLAVVPGNHENTWSQSATRLFSQLWGKDYFCEDLGGTVTVGINCGPYMKMGNGFIKHEDLHWLHETLERSSKDGKRILSFNHYPLQEDLDNYAEYVNLLEQYPVIGHINGHYHTWKQYKGGDIDAAMVRALNDHSGKYGYAIVEIDNDSVKIYEKIVNEEPALKFKWAIKTEHATTAFDNTLSDTPQIKKLWTDSASVFTRLAFDENNVYFGNSLGQFKAVDKNDGSLRWVVETGFPIYSRATVLPSGLIALPCSDKILILDSLGKIVNEFANGPCVADGVANADIYIQGGFKKIEGRSPMDAGLIWKYDSIGNYCQASPVIDNGQVFFGAWDTKLRCLDVTDGRLIWEWSDGKPNNFFSPGNVVPAVNDIHVIIVAPDRYMTCIDRKTGKTIWRDNSRRYRESLGHSVDGTKVYAKTMDGELVIVDALADTFNELGIVDLGLGYEHAPCEIAEIDGTVYTGSLRGIVCAVNPKTMTLLWSHKVGYGEINGIDIDPNTGTPWVSLIDGTVFKIVTHPHPNL